MGKEKNKSGDKKKIISATTPAPDTAYRKKISGGIGLQTHLSLNLLYFNGKPNSWKDISKNNKHCQSFIKFLSLLNDCNYGTLKGKKNFKEYPANVKFEKGFNVSPKVEELIGQGKIVRIAPNGQNTPFRIYGYILENYFFLIWIDPNHEALKG